MSRDGAIDVPSSQHLVFHDVLLQRRDVHRLLYYIFLTALGGASLISLSGMVLGDDRSAFLGGLGAAACLALTLLVKFGFLALAASAGTASLLALAVGTVVTGAGVHDVGIIIFPFVIVVSNLLFNERLAIAGSWLTVFAATAVGVMEASGYLTTTYPSPFEVQDVVVLFAVLGVLAATVQHLVQMMTRGFHRAFAQELSYRNIFNATSEGILIHDAETGVFIDVNDTAQQMSGYTRQDLIGSTIELFAADEAMVREGTKMLERCQREGPQIFPWRGRNKDGQEVPLEITLKSTRLADREVVIAAVRDMTERQEMHNRVLEGEKLQAVGQLAGGVAHDFNNQLTGILANATLLRDWLEDDPARVQCVDAIISCSKRSADLTQQLLAFARRGKHQNVVVDVQELIQEVESLLRRSIDKRIKIELDLSAEQLLLLGDPTLLQNALLNLGLNARDAMPEGGMLTFRTWVEEEGDSDEDDSPRELIVVEVADTGRGMDEATRERIFEPFFTTKKGGNGMGLAAVYGAAESHGGDISVHSRPLEGAAFRLRFPRAAEEEAAQEQSLSRITAVGHLEGLRVLLAEDEVQVLAVAQEILGRLGCKVTACADGEEAVRRFSAAPRDFDAAILDHMMPKVSGREAIREIQKIRPNMPCIITSGYSTDAVVDGTPEKVLFLPKPFSATRLALALSQATDGEAFRAPAK